MTDETGDRPRKGRGAGDNRVGRYERFQRVAIDDGWGGADEEPPPLPTRLLVDSSRSVITRNESPDVPYDRSINPYRGCEHGCVYCFARPSHAWLGLSPGLDFESVLYHKPEAPEQLERALRAPGYVPAPIALGSVTDPYQPVERKVGLTRRVLEVLEAYAHPVMIVTKSALVLRDRDVLERMAARGLVAVALSITSLDPRVARSMEPRAAAPARRLEVVRELAGAGIPVSVLVSPIVPGLTDHELEAIIDRAADAGASGAAEMILRLPGEVGEIFEAWLRRAFPDRADRVMSLLRQCRGGEVTDVDFHLRMSGRGPIAKLIAARFRRVVERRGLAGRRTPLRSDLFKPPPRIGDQLSLL